MGCALPTAARQGWTSTRPEYPAITRLPADVLLTIDPRLGAEAECPVPLASLSAQMGDLT